MLVKIFLKFIRNKSQKWNHSLAKLFANEHVSVVRLEQINKIKIMIALSTSSADQPPAITAIDDSDD